MNEDIKKNELSEEQLESVSGGGISAGICKRCGGKMIAENGWTRCEKCSCRVERSMILVPN